MVDGFVTFIRWSMGGRFECLGAVALMVPGILLAD